jgi:2-C-methyl-D-erythritol 2,4-cyclodiphosphate synthase
MLGGMHIPYPKGLLGHSDADVLAHAVCDALLGALGAGDIGEHFPDTDPRYKGACGVKLLQVVAGLVRKKGFVISNIDSVVIAEEPKLMPFKEKMRGKIAAALKIKADSVSIKAKTNEGLGEVGAKKAIACHAVVLLKVKV